MSCRAWFAAIAIGLVSLSLSEPSQGQTQETKGQHGFEKTSGSASPPLEAEDVLGVEATKREDAEVRKREAESLAAQQKVSAATQEMNVATQRMADYALFSMILVGLGTALLIWTLVLTRQANRSALRAVDVTEGVGKAQVRAYLSIANACVVLDKSINEGIWYVIVGVRNTGQTPAKSVKLSIANWRASSSSDELDIGSIGAGEEKSEGVLDYASTSSIPIPKIYGEKSNLHVNIEISFIDVFGKKEMVEASFSGSIATSGDNMVSLVRGRTHKISRTVEISGLQAVEN